MEGKILYRYPGDEKKTFIIGEGDDSFYLCSFAEKKPHIIKGSIRDYSSIKIKLHSYSNEPFCSDKSTYLSQFKAFQQAFHSREISKAILSRISEYDLKGLELHEIFESLCTNYPAAFCYVFSIDGMGCWAGASPETLMQYENEKIKTVALAGTKYSPSKDVWTDKEREEHGMVDTYIRSLASEKHKLIHASEVQIVQAGSLYHLKSNFEFSSKKEDAKEFLHRIHPTPAICGLPYEKSKKLILEVEEHDRSFYCGYLGVVSSQEERFQMYVNIRCMQIIQDKAYLYIGGGITKDSQGEMEWEETIRKSETMRKIWG